MSSLIEINSFNSFWQDCGSDPYNSYQDDKGIWRCKAIGDKKCCAKNCPEFKTHITEVTREFNRAIKIAKEED